LRWKFRPWSRSFGPKNQKPLKIASAAFLLPAIRLNRVRAEPELMYPGQKIEECHSDRSRATGSPASAVFALAGVGKRGEVEEPFVWKLKTKGGSTSLAMTALGWDTSSLVAR
jgi:hypothetical protein